MAQKKSTQLPKSTDSQVMEFVRIQYNQAFEVFKMQINIFIQVATILVIANVSLIGYAMNQQIAGIVAIGMFFPMVILITISLVNKTLIPVMFTIIRIERTFGKNSFGWFGTTYFAHVISEEFVNQLNKIIKNKSANIQLHELKKIKKSPVSNIVGVTNFIQLLLVIIAIGQVVAAGILVFFFQWRIF